MRNLYLVLTAIIILLGCQNNNVSPPAPFGAIPTQRQLEWHKMKYYAFIHFGPNTFTDIEWGHGDENPNVFNPSELDCRQWARVIKEAGMEGVVITAKHHDGFCLWPSDQSTHTVRESAWRDGKGDVLKDLSEACREYGLKFGVYVSPWDRNHPAYGTDSYNDVYKKTLEEVLTRYGDIFEVWFDGANGEGPNGKKQVYDFPGFAEVVRKHQPMAVMFSDGGPDIRWVGNERGYAADPNWATVKSGYFYPGIPGVNDELQHGHEDGDYWCPTEIDVSIRPGWFYHKEEDDHVKQLEQLVDIYYNSVGKNGNLLLNLPVDTRGLVHENDIEKLMELKAYLDKSFSMNLADVASASASHVRGNADMYAASNALDDNLNTFWATGDEITEAIIEIEFREPTKMNTVLIQEYIALGQRVKNFVIEAMIDGEYLQVAQGITIGNRRLIKFDSIETSQLRINFHAKAAPLISNIEVYQTPENLPQ